MDYGPSLLEQCVGSLPQNYLQISVGEPTQGPRGTFESGGGGGGVELGFGEDHRSVRGGMRGFS